MKSKIEECFEGFEDKISVEFYNILTSEFVKKNNAKLIVRGIRNTTDFEYEMGISRINRELSSDLETIFLTTTDNYISSTLVREIRKLGGDVSRFIPYKL